MIMNRKGMKTIRNVGESISDVFIDTNETTGMTIRLQKVIFKASLVSLVSCQLLDVA